MDSIRLVSLDIETSGLDPVRHRPLAISAVDIASGEDYYVGLEWGELSVSIQAMRVNRIDLTASNRTQEWHLCRDVTRTLPAADAIAEFGVWLGQRREAGDELRALGKNPASLDLPLLGPTWELWGCHKPFPFSHRCVDLNSVFVAIACANGDVGSAKRIRADITKQAWHAFRRNKPDYFAALEEVGGAEHHALGDAWWNVYAWEKCLEMVGRRRD